MQRRLATWYGFRATAAAQARARKVKDAFATADAIEQAFHKAAAYIEIAQAQAKAGDHDGAAKTFDKALELADAAAEAPDSADLDRESFRPQLLQALAAAQAEAGQQQAALAWIARLSAPNLKGRALVGVAEGIAYRAGAKRRPVE